jgi:serine/threonine protein kinase
LVRDVALPADGAGDAIARAQAAKQVFHPSLVTLFDVLPAARGRLLLAYEFVAAQTVAQVSGGQPFNARRAAEIVIEIADAVAEIHARDVVHGAISPSTVIITMKGKAKLDRLGDPSIVTSAPTMDGDLRALGELLRTLVGRVRTGAGAAGLPAIEVLIDRALSGKIESAATLAGLLRKVATP